MTNYDRDNGRSVSAGLLEALDRASKYSEPVALDCSAAADVYGAINVLQNALDWFEAHRPNWGPGTLPTWVVHARRALPRASLQSKDAP